MAIDLTRIGQPGANGLSVLGNPRNPLSTEGVNGDYWINEATEVLFKKEAGVWVAKFSMKGRPGNPGRTGESLPGIAEVAIDGSYHLIVTMTDGEVLDLGNVRGAPGASGAGTGDMLKSENLTGLGNVGTARTNLGLGALAVLAAAGTSNIVDDAVTLAKLDHGTQGDTLYYGAGGAPLRLSAGTLGQFLKSGGPGANPSWGDPSAGGFDYQVFTASGTWTKPAGFSANALVLFLLWGGGGGGWGTTNSSGGGGGCCAIGIRKLSQLGATEAVVIGAGGTAGTPGTAPGSSTFAGATGYKGAGATSSTSGGGGAGLMANASGASGGESGGGAGGSGTGGNASNMSGGGGGGSAAGGRAIFGGGGGAGNSSAGSSAFGGAGGGTGVAGVVPGGGGGANAAGARGELRIWVLA